MSDLIDRQKALEEIYQLPIIDRDAYEFYRDVRESIKSMPSAESEIIRCKDCKWWDRDPESVYGYCMAIKHGYHSSNWEIGIYRKYKGDFYCADAVIEEESDDDE